MSNASNGDEPGSDVAHAPSSILEQLYDGSITATAAGDRLAQWALISSDGDVDSLWSTLVQAAADQADHQHKLVAVFAHISQLPQATKADGQPLLIHGMRVWQDMPLLGWQMNSEWNSLVIPLTPPAERQRGIDEFINVNKLCAKLMKTKQEAFNYSMFALWTFRYALEIPTDLVDSTHSPLEAFVPAAAAWIDIMGDEIYTWDEQLEYGGNKGDPGRNGPLCPEKHGFDHERWTFWRTRFACMAEGREDHEALLGESLKRVARRAHDRMTQIEANASGHAVPVMRDTSGPGLGFS